VAVDPLFHEFYTHMGGQNVLGPAISPIFEYADFKFQYVQAGCLMYDSTAPEDARFRMAALGLDMGVAEEAVAQPDQPGLLYVDGHIIYSGFTARYQELGGARYVGKPLTEVHYNPNSQRYEQYFENLGFYRLESEAPESVHLLAYGAWKCDASCRYVPPLNARVDLPSLVNTPGDRPFRDKVNELGSDFTGFALTEPYQAEDGFVEQIYENIVLAMDPKNPSDVFLRPLPEEIGILPQALAVPVKLDGMSFWEVSAGKGYNVPQAFLDYISAHGGINVSGPPIGELFLTKENAFRQCFTNLCLDYQMGAQVPDVLRIHLAPLGHPYKDLHYKPGTENNYVEEKAMQALSLQVWERFQFISSQQMEEIGASVLQGATPMAQVEPILVVFMPDGTLRTYYFPPTGADGKTYARIDPINAPNGTLIPYEVCISNVNKELFCVKDSFVIWYNQ
jgi:hypothetical protein